MLNRATQRSAYDVLPCRGARHRPEREGVSAIGQRPCGRRQRGAVEVDRERRRIHGLRELVERQRLVCARRGCNGQHNTRLRIRPRITREREPAVTAARARGQGKQGTYENQLSEHGLPPPFDRRPDGFTPFRYPRAHGSSCTGVGNRNGRPMYFKHDAQGVENPERGCVRRNCDVDIFFVPRRILRKQERIGDRRTPRTADWSLGQSDNFQPSEMGIGFVRVGENQLFSVGRRTWIRWVPTAIDRWPSGHFTIHGSRLRASGGEHCEKNQLTEHGAPFVDRPSRTRTLSHTTCRSAGGTRAARAMDDRQVMPLWYHAREEL